MPHNPPDWTDKITNNTLCEYFHIFFIIFSVFAGISLLGGIWIFASSKMSIGQLFSVILNIALSFGISATSALFLYLICERALKPALVARNQVSSQSDYDMM